jgi:predicted dinucleotide-binding enzyme
MKIGVIGSGMIGGTLGALWSKAGHSIMLSSRHAEKLESLAKKIGKKACYGSVKDATVYGEVVLLAIPFYGIIETFPKIRDDIEGKIVIDAMNFFEDRDSLIAGQVKQFKGTYSAFTASKLSGARVIKAFNTIYFKTLETQSNRRGAPLSVPMAGDDEEAKAIVGQLIKDAGFEPYDVGLLEVSEIMQPGKLLWTKELTPDEIKKLVAF